MKPKIFNADLAFLTPLFDTQLTRGGLIWNKVEEQQLLRWFDTGASLEEMCRAHKRRPGGILSRLIVLGRLHRYNDEYEIVETQTQEEPPMDTPTPKPNIENRVFIRGRDAASMKDAEIFALIDEIEKEIDSLKLIRRRPKKLEAVLLGLQNDVDNLATYVDNR